MGAGGCVRDEYETIPAWRVDRVASALLWPYLAWVSFATTLNASIWWLIR